jgi:hypothetical protein
MRKLLFFAVLPIEWRKAFISFSKQEEREGWADFPDSLLK